MGSATSDASTRLIAHKWANALIPDAEPNGNFDRKIGPGLSRVFARWLLKTSKVRKGGLWVGGDLRLYEDRLGFESNRWNSEIQTGTLSFVIMLGTISDVTRRFGVITGIIDISHGGKRTSVRCYGATTFAELLKAAVLRCR